MVKVRRATLDDFEAVSDLLAELGREAVTPANRERLLAVFRWHLERADTASLVAEGEREAAEAEAEQQTQIARERGRSNLSLESGPVANRTQQYCAQDTVGSWPRHSSGYPGNRGHNY